jgi:hypothetical protein
MMRASSTIVLRAALLGAAAVAAVACGNAGDGLGIKLPAGPNVVAQVFYDRNFDNGPSAGDTAFAGIKIYLLVAGTRDTVDSAISDVAGAVSFPSPPVGPYTIAVDSAAALGDSMIMTLTPATVTVAANGPTALIVGRLGYPVLSIGAARASAAGRRVVIRGEVLAGRQTFSDTTAYVRDTSGAIRLTAATVVVGGFTNPGDTVRVLGTVGQRGGQPVLNSARLALVQPSAAFPAYDTLTTALADNALGGTRDADLAFIGGTAIVDTQTVGADFRVTVNDGSGPLEVLFDSLLQVNGALYVPGDSVRATGVLVPTGGGHWELRPRQKQDATVF